MKNNIIKIAAVFGFLAVGLGAFGSHALKESLEAAGNLQTFHTAVSYQFYHTLAILLVGLMMNFNSAKTLKWAAYCFTAGILFFSGSLYAICFTRIKTFGAVAPIGGTLFIVGWALLFFSFRKE